MYKSFNELSKHLTDEQYYNDNNLHYSTLAKYVKEGFKSLFIKEKLETPSIILGSVVDCLLTEEPSRFYERFYVATKTYNSVYQNIIKRLFQKYHIMFQTLDDISDEKILEESGNLLYKPETIIKNVRNEKEYYELLKEQEGKTVINEEVYQMAQEMVSTLRTSDATAFYFSPSFLETEKLYQFVGEATFEGLTYSMKADLIVIDHNEKTISVCDLKTTRYYEYEFYKAFLEYKYYIQATLYNAIIKEMIKTDEYFKNFTVKDFRFIAINSTSLTPLVWDYKHTNNEIITNTGKKIEMRDFKEIGKEVSYYLNNQNIKNPIGITNDVNNLEEWIEKTL